MRKYGSRFRAIAHLSDDKAVAKMGHPIVVLRSDAVHPPISKLLRWMA